MASATVTLIAPTPPMASWEKDNSLIQPILFEYLLQGEPWARWCNYSSVKLQSLLPRKFQSRVQEGWELKITKDCKGNWLNIILANNQSPPTIGNPGYQVRVRRVLALCATPERQASAKVKSNKADKESTICGLWRRTSPAPRGTDSDLRENASLCPLWTD